MDDLPKANAIDVAGSRFRIPAALAPQPKPISMTMTGQEASGLKGVGWTIGFCQQLSIAMLELHCWGSSLQGVSSHFTP